MKTNGNLKAAKLIETLYFTHGLIIFVMAFLLVVHFRTNFVFIPPDLVCRKEIVHIPKKRLAPYPN